MSDKIKVIAILSYGRSGTGLVCSLFDGHPDVSIFPDHIIQNFYKFWDYYEKKDKKIIFSQFIKVFEIIFDPKVKKNYYHKSVGYLGSAYKCGFSELGKNKNKKIKVNKQKFLKYLNFFFSNNLLNRKNFFIAIHFAYNFALYGKKTTNNIVYNLHVPSPDDFRKFIYDFPDAFYIQSIRDPLSGMYSAFKAFNNDKFFDAHYILGIIHHMKTRGNYFFLNKKKVINIKLEELHKKPNKFINLICKKFKISYTKILLKSTINGLMWHNERQSIRISGFNQKITNQKYQNYRWRKDDYIFMKFFKEKYDLLKYKKKNYNFLFSNLIFYICISLPFKIEILQLKKRFNIKNYIKLIICYFKIRYFILKFRNKEKKFNINIT